MTASSIRQLLASLSLAIANPTQLIGVRRDPVVRSGERVYFVAHE